MTVSSIVVVVYALVDDRKVRQPGDESAAFPICPFQFLSQKIRLSKWPLKVSIGNTTGVKIFPYVNVSQKSPVDIFPPSAPP
jgi:hypothetical protein